MNEQFAKVNDVELCYETFGDSGDPGLLLVMGLGTQMVGWNEDFCRELAGHGFHVIRYDNRDVGRSTRFDQVKPPGMWEIVSRKIKRPAYRLRDMADDAAGLLGHLGHDSAHVVGASMGGMIAQVLAGEHPERVLSLTSIMSATGSRWSGQAGIRVYPFFMGRPPQGKEAFVERAVKLFQVIGSPGFDRDEDELRKMAALSFDRGADAAGTMRQLGAVIASGNRTEDLRRIKAPTLVIHGAKDKMVATSGGRATAKAIPGSRLMIIDGMGHDLPRGAWPQIIGGIVENAAHAAKPAASPAA